MIQNLSTDSEQNVSIEHVPTKNASGGRFMCLWTAVTFVTNTSGIKT